MPSLLPADLAQRVYSGHPTPLAEAVWLFETASSPESQREWLQISARTLLRLIGAPLLAARMQLSQPPRRESSNVTALVNRWHSTVLTDDEWVDLVDALLPSAPTSLPELTHLADRPALIASFREFLKADAALSLEQLSAQLCSLLERFSPLWLRVSLVIPQPLEAGARRQSVRAQCGLADTHLFEETALKEGLSFPAGHPVLADEYGEVLLSLHPVAQWFADVPGAADSIFFLEGIDDGAELLRSYPMLVEQRGPKRLPPIASASPPPTEPSASRRPIVIVVTALALAVMVVAGWKYASARARQQAEDARIEAAHRAERQEQSTEAQYATHAAEGIARMKTAARERATSLPSSLQSGSHLQTSLLKIAESLAKRDDAATRLEWLETKAQDHFWRWSDSTPPPPHTLNQTLPDGTTVVQIETPIRVVNSESGKVLRTLKDSDFTVQATCLSRSGKSFAGVTSKGDLIVWDVKTGRRLKRGSIEGPLATACAFTPDGRQIVTSQGDGVIRFIDATSGKEALRISLDQPSHDLLVLRDGTLVYTAGNRVILADSDTGAVREQFEARGTGPITLFNSPSGTRFSAATNDFVRTWEMQPTPVITLDERPNAIAWPPAGDRFASAGIDLRLHDSERRSIVIPIEGEDDYRAVQFSPDGSLLAAQSGTGALSLLQPDGTRPLRIEPEGAAARPFAFSPDGDWLAVGGTGSVSLWSLSQRTNEKTFRTSNRITSIAFSPDGTTLAACDGHLTAWRIATGKRVELGPKTCQHVAFAPTDGSIVVLDDKRVLLQQKDQPALIPLFAGLSDGMREIAFSPRGESLFATDGEHIWWLDTETRRLRGEVPGVTEPVKHLSVSVDGLWLATGPQLIFLPTVFGPELRRTPPSDAAVRISAFSYDGKVLATGGDDQNVTLTNSTTGEVTKELIGHLGVVTALAFNPDGKTLFSGSDDRTVLEWDLASGKQSRVIRLNEPVAGLAFTAQGHELLIVAGPQLLLYDAGSGERLRRFEGGASPVVAFALAPATHMLAEAREDGTVRLWDIETGMRVAEIASQLGVVKALAYSADGQTLAMGRDDGQILFRGATSQGSWFAAHTAAITSLAFSPDGRHLVSTGADKTVRQWRVQGEGGSLQAKEVIALAAHEKKVTHASFSPDAVWFASVSEDRTIRLWNAPALDALFNASPHALLLQARAMNGIVDELSGRRVER